jgi:mRNA interferase RelE/StbE
LKRTEIYERVYELAFVTLLNADSLQDLVNVKAMTGYSGYYRIRLGDYRVRIFVGADLLEMMRMLHRREFYRYFP